MSTLDLSTCTGAEWLAWAAGQFPAIRNRVDLEGLAAKVDTRDAFDALDLWGSGQSEVMQAIVRTLAGSGTTPPLGGASARTGPSPGYGAGWTWETRQVFGGCSTMPDTSDALRAAVDTAANERTNVFALVVVVDGERFETCKLVGRDAPEFAREWGEMLYKLVIAALEGRFP